jgi:hypothetical protein
MANMSYCRFRNTLTDLRDCQANLDDQLDKEEASARKQLMKICQQMVAEWEDIKDEDDLERDSP